MVGAQDIAVCEAVQRGSDAGVDANGRLGGQWENGVFHGHESVRTALDASR